MGLQEYTQGARDSGLGIPFPDLSACRAAGQSVPTLFLCHASCKTGIRLLVLSVERWPQLTISPDIKLWSGSGGGAGSY